MELIFNNLEVVWFILITVLFAGFFLLEGFDYGTGILLPFIGKTDVERRQMINALGPVWDGNEVWMITAGGALFASFPHVYATLFSGFYLALFLMLAALIIRGVSFEFRSKSPNLLWRKTFDYCIFFGSLIPALLWGVTVGNLIQGTPIDASMTYVGTFFDLLSPYTVLCGIAFILVFTYHGGLFTSIKTARTRNTKLGFLFSSLSVISVTAAYFAGLFPRIMVSSLNPEWSLTIANAGNSTYTLTLMTCVAFIFVPIILAYQIWVYWTFRHRVSEKDLHY